MVQPFASNGKTDMFWEAPFNFNASAAGCRVEWNVTPRPLWININYGAWRISSGSRIVWSNGTKILQARARTHSLTHAFPRVQGDLDPWMAGGVTRNITSSLTAYIIAGGAHHLDLMWSIESTRSTVGA